MQLYPPIWLFQPCFDNFGVMVWGIVHEQMNLTGVRIKWLQSFQTKLSSREHQSFLLHEWASYRFQG